MITKIPILSNSNGDLRVIVKEEIGFFLKSFFFFKDSPVQPSVNDFLSWMKRIMVICLLKSSLVNLGERLTRREAIENFYGHKLNKCGHLKRTPGLNWQMIGQRLKYLTHTHIEKRLFIPLYLYIFFLVNALNSKKLILQIPWLLTYTPQKINVKIFLCGSFFSWIF